MRKIFFSYCWSDENVALPIFESLIKHPELKESIDCFLDREINNVGDDYWDNIKTAIDTSEIFIFLNSNNYYNSSACCKEYVWALGYQQNNKIKIIEIKLANDSSLFRPSKSELYVKHYDEEIIEKLLKAIKRDDFSGFERDKLVSNLKLEFFEEKKELKIEFNVNSEIINPTFMIAWNQDYITWDIKTKQPIYPILNSVIFDGFIHSIPWEPMKEMSFINNKNKKIILNRVRYLTKSKKIWNGDKLSFVIKNFNKNSDLFFLIHDDRLGTLADINNWETILTNMFN